MQPRATYRLQLHAGFGFAQAVLAVPYLAELGVSHLYLSPVLQAAAGSTHGYDVVDPDHVSAELGGEAGFEALVRAAKAAGLGILLDIVPNHMSIAGASNRWWLDVLENGPSSYYAHFFDVDWAAGEDRVLLPILGERYGRALTTGTLAIAQRGELFEIRAHEHRFPIAPRALGAIVRRAGDRIAHAELSYLGDALSDLPSPRNRELEARRRRHRDKAVVLRMLGELCRRDATARQALADEVDVINRDSTRLDTVLEAQNYRLVHWTVAGSQLSYRRFFDINTLVGIRNEDADVFHASHARTLRWLIDGTIDGVRIDHVDGLREPAAYLRRLRDVAPAGWIIVEKILARGERLPTSWPIDGTTGYEFMERMNALFVDPAAEARLTQTFTDYTGVAFDPPSESRKARLEVMSDALHSELARLTELAVRACGATPACRDYTRTEIETALAQILAGYPTYRTYFGESEPAPADRERITTATRAAATAHLGLEPDLLAFLDAALAFEVSTPEALELARSAQQVTGPIVAKGDEDTLLYRQVRLLNRCDVGADLAVFAIAADDLHRELAAGGLRSLLATSSHDSKRSEDVRARIAAISELPDAWDAAVQRWRTRAEAGWGDVAPDRILEYAMWQTLVGAWPLEPERAKAWAEKATREARLRTSWRNPEPSYETARNAWIDQVYADPELVAEIAQLVTRLRPLGDRNSLAQLLIKLTAPGVPDFYQGTELRDDSLVDPDNRRAVQLATRRDRLCELGDSPISDAISADLGALKLVTIRRVLGLRRRSPERFEGAYVALPATGTHAARVFAFGRGSELSLITVVPRRGPGEEVGDAAWGDTSVPIPEGTWRDVLSDRMIDGGSARVSELWRVVPVALLERA